MNFIQSIFSKHIKSRFLETSNICNIITRSATKKAGGTVKNGRDSIGKRLGVKKFGGMYVKYILIFKN